jgi:hypothetical protein
LEFRRVDRVINVFERWRTVLEQSNLIIQGGVEEVAGSILDVEDAVGRTAGCGCKDPTIGARGAADRATVVGALVSPIRSHHVRCAGEPEG